MEAEKRRGTLFLATKYFENAPVQKKHAAKPTRHRTIYVEGRDKMAIVDVDDEETKGEEGREGG